ncbi:hypothetical protein LTR86_011313, partial [Recurvomyces mirabilis]
MDRKLGSVENVISDGEEFWSKGSSVLLVVTRDGTFVSCGALQECISSSEPGVRDVDKLLNEAPLTIVCTPMVLDPTEFSKPFKTRNFKKCNVDEPHLGFLLA